MRSKKALELIKRFEGLRLKAYQCPGGKWTIGYGSTRNVKPGMQITEQEAEERLNADILEVERAVEEAVTVPLTQNEFDSLVSFVFNIGSSRFRRSTLLKKLNKGDKAGAAEEFLSWNKVKGKVCKGLMNRRTVECTLFYPEASAIK